MQKLTKRAVEALEAGEKDIFTWDSDVRGFGVRVKPMPSGRKSYIVQYRNGRGQSRRLTIGPHGTFTVETARERARELLRAARHGQDPVAERKAARHAPADPTVADLAERFKTAHAATKKKPSSARMDEVNLRLHVLPALGKRLVSEVTRADITKLHHDMRATPGAANRVLALLSKMFNLAERWGWRADGSNPCRHVEKYPERKMERYLSAAELAVLGEVLAEAERTRTETASTIAAIRLLILTGARLGEILSLQWRHVDHDRRRLALDDSKTGRKVIHLSAPALEVLAGVERREGCPWVIAGAKDSQPLVNLRKPWHRVRERATVHLWASEDGSRAAALVARLERELGRAPTYAECLAAARKEKLELPVGLADVRLHDLRHSFASVGAAGGLSLPIIGALLGHSQPATTARYAHLAADPLKQAADLIGERIAAAMRGHAAEVVTLPQARR